MTATVPREVEELAAPDRAVGDSMTVAAWTAVSRATGVLRGVTIAAVLGATFFANTYQFTNALPNLVYYGFLGGAQFTSLLIPALVRHIDVGDTRAAGRVAGGFFGIVATAAIAATPIAVLLAPFALGGSRTSQALVLMLMPQILLYGVIGSASAVMNAHRKFALAAAAPALENLGTIAVLVLVFFLYPEGRALQNAPLGELLLLGLGTTAAVGVHAAAQWWGARRVGVVLLPRPGWRFPEVREVVRRAVPSLGQAALAAVQLLVLLAFANLVAGGVVAFQLAMNFYFLPVALGATPVALSLAPRLSRMTGGGQLVVFRDTYVRGVAYALFLAVPAAVAYLVLAWPIARAVSFGGFGTGAGIALIAAAVMTLSLGVVGETLFLVTTYACYARGDTRTPLRGMALQTLICLAIASAAFAVHGVQVLTVLGIAQSAGALAGAGYLGARLLHVLPRGTETLLRPIVRIVALSVVMVVPAYLVATVCWRLIGGAGGALVGVLLAAVVGATVYFAGQVRMRAPEMSWVRGALPLDRLRLLAARIPRPSPTSVLARPGITFGLLLGCATFGVLVGVSPEYAVLGLVAIGVLVCVYLRPEVAAYVVIFLTPLVAGIDRGTIVPVFRPNEALALLVGAGLGLRWLMRLRTGGLRLPRLDRVDAALLALAACNSVVPLMMMLVRQRPITGDDLQYALVLWKYLAVYALVRTAVTSMRHVRNCLVLSLASTVLVCAIGIFQSLGLFGVPALLERFYAPFGVDRVLDIGRGSSTLSLPAAVADLAIANLAIVVGMLMRGLAKKNWQKVMLLGVAVVCVLGVGAAAEFSTMIGLVVAFLALAVVTGSRRLLAQAVPALFAAGIVLWPVISNRLAGFQSASGLPPSWVERLRNLTTYFLPELTSDGNWWLGVRVAARVPVSQNEFGWVWIESGYIWLLWGGGLPLVVAFIFFAWATMSKAKQLARRADDAAAVVGIAVFVFVASDVVVMAFDPHLTYRGSGDLLFFLLALLRPLPDISGKERQREAVTRAVHGRERTDLHRPQGPQARGSACGGGSLRDGYLPP